MTGPQGGQQIDPAAAREIMIRHLRELIRALDARTPHLERAGEMAIAREAARLRQKALTRLAELGASPD
jgi:hypothetical protein